MTKIIAWLRNLPRMTDTDTHAYFFRVNKGWPRPAAYVVSWLSSVGYNARWGHYHL